MAKLVATGGHEFIVDSDVAALIGGQRWHVKFQGAGTKKPYPARSVQLNGKTVRVMLHRFVIGAKPGELVDHINGDTLDNRRCNLRVCTHEQNAHNTRNTIHTRNGLPKGVYRGHSKSTPWEVRIRAGEKVGNRRNRVFVGSFKTIEEAAAAYDAAAIRFFGEFAATNFDRRELPEPKIIPPPPDGFPPEEVEADLRPLTPAECRARGIRPSDGADQDTSATGSAAGVRP